MYFINTKTFTILVIFIDYMITDFVRYIAEFWYHLNSINSFPLSIPAKQFRGLEAGTQMNLGHFMLGGSNDLLGINLNLPLGTPTFL